MIRPLMLMTLGAAFGLAAFSEPTLAAGPKVSPAVLVTAAGGSAVAPATIQNVGHRYYAYRPYAYRAYYRPYRAYPRYAYRPYYRPRVYGYAYGPGYYSYGPGFYGHYGW